MKIARYYFDTHRQKHVVDSIYTVIRETKTQLVAVLGNNDYEYRFKKPKGVEPGTQVFPVNRDRFSMFSYIIYDDKIQF